MRNGVDLVSLISGVTVAALGGLLILDQSGDLELSAGVLAAVCTGAFGLIMVISGLLEDR
jgi:hypothetical protein